MVDEPDYYKILQIKATATAEELRQQHRKLVRELHPDRHHGDPAYVERLTQVNSAYHVLKDEFRRSAYDRRRREAAAKPVSTARPSRPVRPQASVRPQSSVKSPPALRPMNARYASKAALYSMHPAAKKTRKRNALIGGIIAGILACSLITLLFTLSSTGVQQSLLDAYNNGMSMMVVRTPAEQAAELKAQYQAIMAAYEERISNIQSEAQDTVTASYDDATALDNVGDHQQALALKRDASSFLAKIAAVESQILTLNQKRAFSDEAKLETSLDQSLDDLDETNQQLSREAQDMRRDSTDIDSMPDPSQANSEMPFPVNTADSTKTPASAGMVQ